MSTYLTSLFGLEGKVALLTGAGGYLVDEMSRVAELAGTKVLCSDLRLEDAQRTAQGLQCAGWIATCNASKPFSAPRP